MNKRFALLPTRLTSGKKAWLSFYYEYRSLYDASTGRPPLNNLYFVFTETSAERTMRLLKESVVHNRNVWNDPALTKRDNNARNNM